MTKTIIIIKIGKTTLKTNIKIKNILTLCWLAIISLHSINAFAAGENAQWMKGSWGLNWKPV